MSHSRRYFLVVLPVVLPVVLLQASFAVAVFAAGDGPVDYSREVKPILRERCWACHGALKQQAGLRLDTGESIRRGGDDRAVLVAGNAGGSRLIERITAADAAVRMPPLGQPLTPEQVATIRDWIDQGATSPAGEVPEEDPRTHWAFLPPLPAAVQFDETDGTDGTGGGAINAFIASSQEKLGLQPRPPADKAILLRRVYLDLIGLPPTREELSAFLVDDSPRAFEAVVDRLLADPRYGERWARHWMDIWRYSDWYGRRYVPDVWNSAPQLWRWRDWIVRSLNEDKGYDRMLQEMLAADEICPEDAEAAVATGYLIRNWYALNPNDWMRSTVEHTGKAFLGLTFHCAHCHDHKYDPIAQEDYFRLRAFFEPIGVRQDRVAGEADPGPFQEYQYSVLRKIQRLGAVRIFDKTPAAPTWFYTGGDERNRLADRGSIPPGVPGFLSTALVKIEPLELPPRAWYPGLQPAIQQTVLGEARAAVASCQAAVQAAVGGDADAPPDPVSPWALAKTKLAAARAELAAVEARIAADRAKYGESPGADAAALTQNASRLERAAVVAKTEADCLLAEHAVAIAWAKPTADASRVKELDAANAQLASAQAALDKAKAALADAALAEKYSPLSPAYPASSTGRRRALALWITDRQNPLTARVAVNHIWSRHFHSPLVSSVTDFGRNGARPTHPELLDWLAVELMESGWSMKHMHRLIVTSAPYRRASSVGGATHEAAADPENRLLWRMNVGRMEAEVVRDSLLFVAGRLDGKMGGQELENNEALKTHRRSVYYAVYPEEGGKSALGELFDAPDALDCYRRTRSIVPQQALALTNSEFVHQISAAIAGEHSGGLDRDFVISAFERILSRPPTEAELQTCRAFLSATAGTDPQQLRASLIRVMLNHNDFVTIR